MKLIPWILLVIALPALAQEAPPPAERPVPDILEISPDELSGPGVEEIRREAQVAYREKRYADAARAFIRTLQRSPGDSNALYNLACCYGLLGAEDQAARFLAASWKAGFRDIEHIRRDPDFDPVRKSRAFEEVCAELAAEAEERRKRAGKRLSVAAEVVADVRVVVPEDWDPGRRYPLLIGLHGYGDNGESFLSLFSRRELEPAVIYCTIQAPYAFHVGGKVGYSWTLRGPGAGPAEAMRSARLSTKLVLAALDAVRKQYPVDERNVFLFGFSQGAGLSFTVGMKHPERFRGVIPIGGWLDPAEHTDEQIARARKRGLFLICHSPEDRVVQFDSAKKATEFLAEESIPHRLIRYQGGHSLPKGLLEQVLSWIEDPKPTPAMELEKAR